MSALQRKVKISRNARIKGNYFKLALEDDFAARTALPGQFVMVKVEEAVTPFLRRPLGIHQVHKNIATLLYEVLGPGTEILSRRKRGEYLDIIGPLGNGFPLPAKKKLRPILVSGGMGVAPLLFLAQKLSGSNLCACPPIVLIGSKNKKQLLCEQEFKEAGCAVKVATDDGSLGFKGYVSGLLKKQLSTTERGPSSIYACGPNPMLKEVSRIALGVKIPAYLSLEEHMACGIGACLGCAVETRSGYKRVCKEGPVFKAEEITWR